MIGTLQSRMHLLLREMGLAPAKIADHGGAVRERFPGPEPHHSRFGNRVPGRPIHRAGLLLHDPERALSDAAVEVVVEGGDVGQPGFEIGRLFGGVARELLGEAERVGIPAREIERRGGRPVIEVE